MGCTDASDLRVYFSVSCTFLVILIRPGEGAGGTTGFHNPEDEDEARGEQALDDRIVTQPSCVHTLGRSSGNARARRGNIWVWVTVGLAHVALAMGVFDQGGGQRA